MEEKLNITTHTSTNITHLQGWIGYVRSKQKGVTAASLSHPNSRKVRQLTKQVQKEAARKKSKLVHEMRNNLMGEKFLWFRDIIPKDVTSLDHETIASFIEQYLKRFDDELEQIQYKHSIGKRKNRQHASREDIIILTKKREEEEYRTCGIELPDLLLPSQVETLKKWNGELRFLQNFKLRRFSLNLLKSGKSKSRPSSPVQNQEQTRSILKLQGNIEDNSTEEVMDTDVKAQ